MRDSIFNNCIDPAGSRKLPNSEGDDVVVLGRIANVMDLRLDLIPPRVESTPRKTKAMEEQTKGVHRTLPFTSNL
jgi:hypothetical protein